MEMTTLSRCYTSFEFCKSKTILELVSTSKCLLLFVSLGFNLRLAKCTAMFLENMRVYVDDDKKKDILTKFGPSVYK